MNGHYPERITAGILILAAASCLCLPVLADHVPPPFVVEEVPLDIQWVGRTMSISVSPTSDAAWLVASESGGLSKTADGGARHASRRTADRHGPGQGAGAAGRGNRPDQGAVMLR